MADGLAITPGTGAIAATDEITTENGVGVSARHAQRVKLDVAGTDGAFTDLSAANPLPVSGAFFPATQPVSIAASVAVTGPLTDTQLRLTPVPISGTVTTGGLTDTQIRASALPVSLASTTVTGSVTISAALPTGTNAIGSVSVTGTTAISAVSLPLPAGAATETTLAALNTKVTAVNTGAVTISAALPTGANTIGTTTGPTLTKATQGATGYSVQDLKDAGRVIVNAATAIAGVTCVTAEALLALNISRDGAATASATSHTVTAGKRWRITGMIVSARSTGATVLSARVALRMNPAGAATATSPVIAIASMTQQAAALAEAGDTCVLTFPDGIEISGTMQVGLSQVCSAITGVVYASLIGYEY